MQITYLRKIFRQKWVGSQWHRLPRRPARNGNHRALCISSLAITTLGGISRNGDLLTLNPREWPFLSIPLSKPEKFQGYHLTGHQRQKLFIRLMGRWLNLREAWSKQSDLVWGSYVAQKPYFGPAVPELKFKTSE